MGYEKYMISAREAQSALATCMDQVEAEPGDPVAVAIVDDAGNLVSCLRMDGAKPYQLKLAISKAFTASIGELTSSEFGVRDRGWDRELANYNEGRFTQIPGGAPIKVRTDESDRLLTIGGVGVSGRSPEDDERFARESAHSAVHLESSGSMRR